MKFVKFKLSTGRTDGSKVRKIGLIMGIDRTDGLIAILYRIRSVNYNNPIGMWTWIYTADTGRKSIFECGVDVPDGVVGIFKLAMMFSYAGRKAVKDCVPE